MRTFVIIIVEKLPSAIIRVLSHWTPNARNISKVSDVVVGFLFFQVKKWNNLSIIRPSTRLKALRNHCCVKKVTWLLKNHATTNIRELYGFLITASLLFNYSPLVSQLPLSLLLFLNFFFCLFQAARHVFRGQNSRRTGCWDSCGFRVSAVITNAEISQHTGKKRHTKKKEREKKTGIEFSIWFKNSSPLRPISPTYFLPSCLSSSQQQQKKRNQKNKEMTRQASMVIIYVRNQITRPNSCQTQIWRRKRIIVSEERRRRPKVFGYWFSGFFSAWIIFIARCVRMQRVVNKKTSKS